MDTSPLAFVDSALSALEAGFHDRGSDIRNVQLATGSPGGHPELRTVVLRGFGRSPAWAEFHTDARAGKVRDIAAGSAVTLLAWSPAERLQLRFEGLATVHRADGVARERWDALSVNARRAYGLRATPGAPTGDPGGQSNLPPAEQFGCFAVVLVVLATVDVLRLGAEGGQTRAAGRFTPDGIEAGWIGP